MKTVSVYIDAHLHLQDECLHSDIDGVIRRAKAAGVIGFCCNGTKPSDWPQVLDFSGLGVTPFLGLHPWEADNAMPQWFDALECLVQKSRCGIGEIGLDWAKTQDRGKQQAVFEAQLELAVTYRRPVSIHCVKAWEAVLQYLHKYPLSQGFMMHAFNGSLEIARGIVELGGYVSFNALSFTQNRRAKSRQLLELLPQDRVLFETESPHGLNKAVEFIDAEQVNEPANLPAIIREAAELIGVDVSVYARTVYENSVRFMEPLKALKI